MDGKTIMLVEDNPSDVGLTKRALERNGIVNDLVVASDGQEALDYLFCKGEFSGRKISDTPILILLDLKLPKVGGLEVLRIIRSDERTRRIPIVILSSSQEAQDIISAYDGGTNSYIAKPVDFERFTEVIRQLGLYWLVLNEPAPKE